jgi:hypothetical protein
MKDEGSAVIHTAKGREKCGIKHLTEKTTFVHINGPLNLWAVEGILQQAPNLKTIQVIPSMFKKLHPDSHLRLCQERGVAVVTGHVRPELVWEEGRIVSPHYQAQKAFLTGVSGDQKKLFDELIALGFEAALMTSRYYCLNGEEFLSQRALCADFGYGENINHYFSAKINAVLCYLDEAFEASLASKRLAKALRANVIRLRPYLESAELRKQCAERLRIPQLASKFPLARLDTFEKLLEAFRSGRLAQFALESPDDHRALVLRFGLEELALGAYRTLEEVGNLTGVTRERVRQREERALKILGITEEV